MPQADFGQRVDEILPGSLLDEAAERNFGHVDRFGDVTQGDLPAEVAVHVGENGLETLRIGHVLLLYKGQIGEQFPFGGEREGIENGKHIEQRLHASGRSPLVDTPKSGSHFESCLFRKEHPARKAV